MRQNLSREKACGYGKNQTGIASLVFVDRIPPVRPGVLFSFSDK